MNTGVKEIIRSSGNLDINFVSTNKPRLNIQLGHAAQSVMIKFGGQFNLFVLLLRVVQLL